MMLFRDIQGYWIVKYKKQYLHTYMKEVGDAIWYAYIASERPTPTA